MIRAVGAVRNEDDTLTSTNSRIHAKTLNSNITDATAMQVYRAAVCPGLIFANWRYARSPKNSPITTQTQ